MPKIKTSVIMCTYNIPKSLTLTLAGYKRQSVRNFELIIADDGSGSETKEIIDKFSKSVDFEVRHIWQENKGFGVTKIFNKATLISRGDLIIYTASDCIPERDLVKSHIDSYAQNSFLCGARVDMDLDFCKTLTPERIENGDFEKYLSLLKKLEFEWTHLKSLYYIAVKKRDRPKIWGCNMSVDRKALFDVNGYDEDFDAGADDDDIRNRLIMYDVKPISIWNRSTVFHLDHAFDEARIRIPPRSRERESELRRTIEARKSARCANGLVKENEDKRSVTSL